MANKQELKGRLEKHMDVLCNQIGERHMGSEGEKKAIKYIEDQFKSFGYEVVREEFDAPGWKYGKFSLSTVETGKSFSCFPCHFSNSCAVEGKLKVLDVNNLNELSPRKVKGEICFYLGETDIGSVGGRNKLAEKLDKMGARVLIIISNFQDTENTKIVRTPFLKHLGVMTVSRNTALEIARNLHNTFRIKIEAENFPAKSANVVAGVEGKSNKKIVIGAHYDTAPGIPGALDNASGVAAVIEIARLFKNRNKDYSMDFVAFGGEEFVDNRTGYALGSYDYVTRHKTELKRILWLGTLDSVGDLLSKDVIHVRRSKKILKLVKNTFTEASIKTSILGGDEIIFDTKGIPSVSFCSKYERCQIHSPKDDINTINFDNLTVTCQKAFDIFEKLL